MVTGYNIDPDSTSPRPYGGCRPVLGRRREAIGELGGDVAADRLSPQLRKGVPGEPLLQRPVADELERVLDALQPSSLAHGQRAGFGVVGEAPAAGVVEIRRDRPRQSAAVQPGIRLAVV